MGKFPVRGILSRGGRDVGYSDLLEAREKTARGRSGGAWPDSNGFIMGVEGKSCNNRLWFLTCLSRKPSLWLIWIESNDPGRNCACDATNGDGGGARIKGGWLRHRLFAIVVARSGIRGAMLRSAQEVLMYYLRSTKCRMKRDSFPLGWPLSGHWC